MSEYQRENIIRAASAKMREVGIKSVSIDDLCRDLGISKKTFYVHFETKDLFIEALLKSLEKEIEQNVLKRIKGKTLVELTLKQLKLTKETQDVRSVPVLLYDLQKYYPLQYKNHLKRMEIVNRRLVAMQLKNGIEEGFFRSDLDIEMTCIVFARLHQMLINKLTHTSHPKDVEIAAKYAIDIFIRGLISEEGKKMIEEALKKKSDER